MMKKPHQKIPSVTEVAQLGACERQMLFDEQVGRRRSGKLERQAKEGIRVHKKYERMVKTVASDKRCFIATEVFGPTAWQTNMFRSFRDQVLLKSPMGQAFVSVYYSLSPFCLSIVRKLPFLKKAVKRFLQYLAEVIARRQSR